MYRRRLGSAVDGGLRGLIRGAGIVLCAGLLAAGAHLSAPRAAAAVTIQLGGECLFDVVPPGATVEYTGFRLVETYSGLDPTTRYGRLVTDDLGQGFSFFVTDVSGSFGPTSMTAVYFPESSGRTSVTWTATIWIDTDQDLVVDSDETVVAVSAPFTMTCVRSLEDLLGGALSDGSLSGGEASSLLAKVDAAGASADRDNITAAIRQLEAFIEQVRALTAAGRIPAATGATLTQAAQARIDELRARL